jgi:hypothetical protein
VVAVRCKLATTGPSSITRSTSIHRGVGCLSQELGYQEPLNDPTGSSSTIVAYERFRSSTTMCPSPARSAAAWNMISNLLPVKWEPSGGEQEVEAVLEARPERLGESEPHGERPIEVDRRHDRDSERDPADHSSGAGPCSHHRPLLPDIEDETVQVDSWILSPRASPLRPMIDLTWASAFTPSGDSWGPVM